MNWLFGRPYGCVLVEVAPLIVLVVHYDYIYRSLYFYFFLLLGQFSSAAIVIDRIHFQWMKPIFRHFLINFNLMFYPMLCLFGCVPASESVCCVMWTVFFFLFFFRGNGPLGVTQRQRTMASQKYRTNDCYIKNKFMWPHAKTHARRERKRERAKAHSTSRIYNVEKHRNEAYRFFVHPFLVQHCMLLVRVRSVLSLLLQHIRIRIRTIGDLHTHKQSHSQHTRAWRKGSPLL